MKRPFLILGSFLWILALLFAFLPSWPHIYYRLSPQTSQALAQVIAQSDQPPPTRHCEEPCDVATPSKLPLTPPHLPPTNPSLPQEPGLIIESIGVRGEIHQGDNWQEILKQGVWQVPNFGTPEDNSQPIILAAHRWGYLAWTNQFRYLNSFYNLPKIKTGNEILINWNQRQYKYQVYKEETGEKITDYSADLILYTCQLWNSPIRIFVYAKRLN